MKDDKVLLKHIVEAADKISEYIKDISREEFVKKAMLLDAVNWQIMIIGGIDPS